MNMDEMVIKCDKVSKMYKLYDAPSDRVKEALNLTKKKMYKEHYALSEIDLTICKGEWNDKCKWKNIGIAGTRSGIQQ